MAKIQARAYPYRALADDRALMLNLLIFANVIVPVRRTSLSGSNRVSQGIRVRGNLWKLLDSNIQR